MKVRTTELQGAALDWAVAECEKNWAFEPDGCDSYSTDWQLGGPIVEREKIGITPTSRVPSFAWAAHCIPDEGVDCYAYGPTPLIAAMRCYVASKLGDEVEIPAELCV